MPSEVRASPILIMQSLHKLCFKLPFMLHSLENCNCKSQKRSMMFVQLYVLKVCVTVVITIVGMMESMQY